MMIINNFIIQKHIGDWRNAIMTPNNILGFCKIFLKSILNWEKMTSILLYK